MTRVKVRNVCHSYSFIAINVAIKGIGQFHQHHTIQERHACLCTNVYMEECHDISPRDVFMFAQFQDDHKTWNCEFQVFSLKPNKGNEKLPTNGCRQVACECFGRLKLDYCNSIYAGLLQDCCRNSLIIHFNVAARLIVYIARSTHITSLLRVRLHWLQTLEIVKYKLCVIVFKVLHGTAPVYISQLCIRWNSTLRSSSI